MYSSWNRKLLISDSISNTVFLFIGHILRLLTTRPASLALEWRPKDGRRRSGRPRRTWQDTLKDIMDIMGVDWSDVKDTANDLARWRQLAQRSAQNGRK